MQFLINVKINARANLLQRTCSWNSLVKQSGDHSACPESYNYFKENSRKYHHTFESDLKEWQYVFILKLKD